MEPTILLQKIHIATDDKNATKQNYIPKHAYLSAVVAPVFLLLFISLGNLYYFTWKKN